MAQGAVALAPAPVHVAGMSPEELREIEECQQLCALRDAVFTGTHPRIRLPAHLITASKSTTTTAGRNGSSSRTPVPIPAFPTTAAITYNGSSSPYTKPVNSSIGQHASLPIKPTQPEIDPIFLEKADVVQKAEIRLRREALERALQEQIQQQRFAQKALLQTADSLPNFDLTEVLSKALAIVHPSAAVEAAPSVGAASDSFDDNTFYSSQHDTPDLSSPSHGQRESGDVQSNTRIADENPAKTYSTQIHVGDQEKGTSGASLSNDSYLATGQKQQSEPTSPQHPSSHAPATGATPAPGFPQQTPSKRHAFDTLGSSSNVGTASFATADLIEHQIAQKTTEELYKTAFGNERTSPLIRAHDLSPVAPQPARVSPLALAREPPVIHQHHTDEPPPAQVAALREKPSENSSTESSPRGTKQTEKKKKKDKKSKRRSGVKEAIHTPESPVVKAEPRSPSPFAVAPLPRPAKRQRVAPYGTELNYDEPRYDQGPEPRPDQPRATQYVERREQPAYERYEEAHRPIIRAVERVEREEGQFRRVSDGQYTRRISPGPYEPYPVEVRPRSVSHATLERRAIEIPKYYRDLPPRASVRPDTDRDRSRSPVMRDRLSPALMGPPRQPVRIVVDEYGREYIDPTVVRQSMAPPARRDVIYERAPIRAASGRAPVETFEEDGVLYRRASPHLAPRRVVTQPEYVDTEYRQYRQREYSARPVAMAPPADDYTRQREYSVRPAAMAPPGEEYVRPREYSVRQTTMAPPSDEYIQIRGPALRREVSHFDEAPREYIRAPSVRPEPVRYELPREYVSRQSVRPEAPGREYTGSVRPEARREYVMPPPQREYSVRPMEAPRREYIPVEADRYYEGPDRRTGEVAYVERPQETVEVAYAEDARRAVYR
ncbi:hypothetical protein PVAG01_10082 [Phlyctema vagabunda]|uniref:Uncharacterized protein n=1 Tax=Phlyctema vagabunda TaxID=108571 RepID=A0ABR4P4Y4_9HELO